MHRTCAPGGSVGLKSQLSRIRRNMHPSMSEKGGITHQAVLTPPVAALQVEKLRARGEEFDAKQLPREKLRKLMHGTGARNLCYTHEMRTSLLQRYGIQLDQVATICKEHADANAANRQNKRRLHTKTPEQVQCGDSGVEEGAGFKQARLFKAREGKSGFAAEES